MKAIRPTTITEAMLVASSVPEDDAAAWSGATTYGVGDRVMRAHVVWESLQAGNLNHDPSTDASDPPYWLEVSSTNRWRMFDGTVNSLTTATGSIVVDVQPGIINAVGLVELQGSTVRVQLLDGASVVYDSTQAIDSTPIDEWAEYFFEPYAAPSALVFEDLPSYLTGTVRITIAGSSTVACGGVALGRMVELGTTLADASAGITDYSRKTTSEFGVTSIVVRAFAKRASVRLMLGNADLARVHAVLADMRSTPALWIGADEAQKYAPLVVFGWYRDFQIEVAYRDYSYCSLELEGMI